MDADEARRVLGLGADADLAVARARHRTLIRSAHPDAGGDARRAADLNAALAALERLGHVPRVAPPAPPPSPSRVSSSPSPDADRILHLDLAPRELVLRLAEAGHGIGEVVFADPLAGLIEIVVGHGPAAAQLTVGVGDPGPDGVPVAFTLETLGRENATPRIGTVVDDLLAALTDGLC